MLRPLVLAVHVAILAVAAASLIPQSAMAADAAIPAAAVKSYAIESGSLTSVLGRFAAAAGVALSFDPALTADRQSSALKGSYTVEGGFAYLLNGTDLQVERQSGGGYTMRRVIKEANQEAILPAVTVKSAVDTVSEGSGSYTTRTTTSSTGLNLSFRETPQTISVVTRSQIEDQALYSLPSVLKQVPGINYEQADSERYNIYARGFGVDNFLVDGMPMSSYGTGAYELLYQSQMDMVAFDRVEIVKGATGLMRGAGSPAASINMIRKKATKELQGTVQATIGSWNLRRLEGDISGPLNEAGTVRGRVVMVDEHTDSFIDRYGREKKSVFGILEADLTRATTLSVSAHHMDNSVKGMPFNGAVPMFYSDGTRIDLPRTWSQVPSWSGWESKNTHIGADLDHYFDSGWVAKLSYANQRNESTLTSATYNFPNRDGSGVLAWRDAYLDDTSRDTWRVNVSGPFEILGRTHEAMFGINMVDTKINTDAYYDWNGYSPANFFTESANIPMLTMAQRVFVNTTGMNTRERSGYGAIRMRATDALSVIVGTRVSSWTTTNASIDRLAVPNVTTTTEYKNSSVVTPYVGAVLDLSPNYSVYASYTDIFTPQSYRDAQGALLGPVDGSAYETGIKGEFFDKKLNATVAVYRVKQDNLGENTGTLFNGQPVYVGIPGAVATGVEAEIAGELQPGWQINAGIGRNSVRDAYGQEALTNSARSTFKLFTTYRLPAKWSQLTVGGGVRWQGRTYRNGAGPNNDGVLGTADDRLEQAAYSVVDLMASYKLTPKVSLALNINNLFDKSYLTTLRQGAQYGSPRYFSASVRMRF